MHQSEGIVPRWLQLADRFVQWSSPHDDFDFTSSFAAVPNIEELKNLETLDLCGTGITGTVDFKHHPMMTQFYQLTIRVTGERKQAIKSMMQTQAPGCTVHGV